MSYELLLGDAVTVLRTLDAGSVQTCVSSPPYYGLRAYLTDDHPDKALEIGTEQTPEAYVAKLVEVFREVRRVLHPTGTIWVNLGDSYNGSNKGYNGNGTWADRSQVKQGTNVGALGIMPTKIDGLKAKDLIGIPWLVAFALRADGWWLRSAITWCKGNPMTESVLDRPTSATEQMFLLAKNERYFYDSEAIREPASPTSIARINQPNFANQTGGPKDYRNGVNTSRSMRNTLENFAKNPGRNRRNWWVVNSEPYSGSHYAVMPTKLVEPCILAGTSAHGCCAKCGAPWARVVERETRAGTGIYDRVTEAAVIGTKVAGTSLRGNPGKNLGVLASETIGWQPTCTCNADIRPCVVLDPFFGSGTTAAVAIKHGRNFIGIDLDPKNISLAHERIQRTQPMLLEVI